MDRNNGDWYPRLVSWKNWEIPRPGTEAIVGFFIVLAVSLGLHLGVIFLCTLFR
jgi:hypothetical protein